MRSFFNKPSSRTFDAGVLVLGVLRYSPAEEPKVVYRRFSCQ